MVILHSTGTIFTQLPHFFFYYNKYLFLDYLCMWFWLWLSLVQVCLAYERIYLWSLFLCLSDFLISITGAVSPRKRKWFWGPFSRFYQDFRGVWKVYPKLAVTLGLSGILELMLLVSQPSIVSLYRKMVKVSQWHA